MVMNPMAEIPYLLYDQGKEHRQKNPTSFQSRFSMLEGGCRVHQNLTICLCFMHLHSASSNPSNPNPESVTEAKPVESHDSILRVNNCWSETWIMGEVHLTISNSYFFVISFIWMENSISPARNLWICEMFGGPF